MRAPDHLNALRAFEAAARHLSFALAAEELNVTPAAVGQLVRRLEEVLGAELFHRSQSGPARLVLTEAAEAALPELQTGFDHLTKAMERLKSARSHRVLSVTVSIAFADKWLLHRLNRFEALHQKYELRIDTSYRLVDFTVERFDLGLRYGRGHWPDVASTFFDRDAFFPVCSPSLLEGSHPLRSIEDLRYHPLIHDVSMASEPLFPGWRDWFVHAGLPPGESERGLRINDSAAAFRMVLAGNGIALGRTMLVERDLAEGRLVRPFGPELDCPLGYYLVYRPQDAKDPAIVAFRDWLLSEVAGKQDG